MIVSSLIDTLEEVRAEYKYKNIIHGCVVCRNLYELSSISEEIVNYLKSNVDINVEFIYKRHLRFEAAFLYKEMMFYIAIKRHDEFVKNRSSLFQFVFIPENIDDYNQYCKHDAMVKMRYATKPRLIYYK